MPQWDASVNRHIGQRNIHVISAPQMMTERLIGGSGPPAVTSPILLNVGPLYGAAAQVSVERVMPSAMPWLQLHTGVRGSFPTQAVPTGAIALSPASPIGGGLLTGQAGTSQHVDGGDDQQIAFTTTDAHPAPGEAHVYRVSARQDGQTFGGYTVVLLG
jgi:hypothetical protein